tara:strand:+ start:111 stop:563 length:453 start_codon:yes stop_codon:yes gene_type:complete
MCFSQETIEERLREIEKRLDQIEKLLQPLELLNNSENSKKKNDENSNEKKYTLNECLKVIDQKISITEKNTVYHEYSWIIEYQNSCPVDFIGYPEITFLDKDEFNLHESSVYDPIKIPANGKTKARGQEMISPEKSMRVSITSAGFKSSY